MIPLFGLGSTGSGRGIDAGEESTISLFKLVKQHIENVNGYTTW